LLDWQSWNNDVRRIARSLRRRIEDRPRHIPTALQK
jgi:hypothetical protein